MKTQARRSLYVALYVALPAALAGPAQAEPFVYVANAADDNVIVIDRAIDGVVDHLTVDFAGGPDLPDLAVSPDGERIYVADNGWLRVIDAATNEVIESVNGDPLHLGVSSRDRKSVV